MNPYLKNPPLFCYTIKVMDLQEFNYYLPPGLIAQHPLARRDASRLMAVERNTGEIRHSMFHRIHELLPSRSLLIINNSKVIPARIFCRKANTGGMVEVLLTRRHSDHLWEGLVKPGRRVAEGCRLIARENELEIVAGPRNSHGTRYLELRFGGDFWQMLEKCGETPLPPYIKEKLDKPDRYQTIYARQKGSVAAPTAGLHFTSEVFEKLSISEIDVVEVTLHVGPGTFRPVKVANIEEHKMEGEYFSISADTASKIRGAKAQGRKIIGVGTTAVRTVESAFRINEFAGALEGRSELFIYPGFDFKVIDILITNFHLPCSTLLMLASAFAGEELLMRAYEEAMKARYRFYSFGDAMLIL